MSVEQNLSYIFHSINYLAIEVYVFVRSWCKNLGANYETDSDSDSEPESVPELNLVIIWEDFYVKSCKEGTLYDVKGAFEHGNNLDPNIGLCYACEFGNTNVAEWLINEKKANTLDQCLEVACKNNRLECAELLVKKGANIKVGLRNSSSLNIIRMLYRYKQKTEMIQ